MSRQCSPAARAVIPVFLVAALFAAAADAKGGRRSGGGSSSSSSSAGKSHAHDESSGFKPSINLRSSSSSSSSSGGASAVPLAGMRPEAEQRPASDAAADPEEEARRAANLAIYQRLQAQKAAAEKAAAEKAQEMRIAAEKEAAARNAQLAAQQRAEAARVAAAQAEQRRKEEAIAADVDRVLQRAKVDYPLLATPEGAPWLRKIVDRQQAIAATGVYPSIAMVEAISDHAYALAPRPRAEVQMVSTNLSQAPAAAKPAQAPSLNGCRWVTAIKWACD